MLAIACMPASAKSQVYMQGGVGGHCLDGACVPNPANFGYYQTGWRRWPTSRPTSLHSNQRSVGPTESLPTIDLPNPLDEGELNPSPRFESRQTPVLPPQSPVTPPLPPLRESMEPDPSLPPLQLPEPQAEEQGAIQMIEQETIVAWPVPSRKMPAQNTSVAQTRISQPTNISNATVGSRKVRAVSWDNPLRDESLSNDEQPLEHSAREAELPRGTVFKLQPAVESESSRRQTPELTAIEPARIQLPDNVTPLPPREPTADLGSESDFVWRRNPVRNEVQPTIAPTAFYGDVAENPLRRAEATGRPNPLRRTVVTGVPSERSPNGTPMLTNPLRGVR